MQKQKEPLRRKNILAFALWGLISFGVGGAIGATTAARPALIFVFPIMGAVGGASIGLLFGKRVRAIVMALVLLR